MPKLPYMQFYVADFMMDVQTLDMNIRGAWITLLCLLWRTKNGSIKLTTAELAKLWNIDNISAQDDLDIMIASRLFEHKFEEKTQQNIIKSRRIQRDRKRLKQKADWASRQRVDKKKTPHRQDVDGKIQIQIQNQIHKQIKDSRTNERLSEFERFWENYPRKVGKGAAQKSWIRAAKDEPGAVGLILPALLNQRKGFNYEDGKRFIPLPATWLNQKRWLDEVGGPSTSRPTPDPTKIDSKKEELAAIAQREWERLHPIDQLDPGDVPF